MTKPFYHPILVVFAAAMAGLGLWFLAQGIFAIGIETWQFNEAPGSFGAQVTERIIQDNYISDWPSFVGGLVWMSLFMASLVMGVIHMRLAFKSAAMRGKVPVELPLSNRELAELTDWLEQGRVPLEKLKGVWS
jgi:hypothetical protein